MSDSIQLNPKVASGDFRYAAGPNEIQGASHEAQVATAVVAQEPVLLGHYKSLEAHILEQGQQIQELRREVTALRTQLSGQQTNFDKINKFNQTLLDKFDRLFTPESKEGTISDGSNHLASAPSQASTSQHPSKPPYLRAESVECTEDSNMNSLSPRHHAAHGQSLLERARSESNPLRHQNSGSHAKAKNDFQASPPAQLVSFIRQVGQYHV